MEIIVVCAFNCTLIALPEILVVNKVPKAYLSIPVIPLMLFLAPNKTSTFSPTALYALWYVNGSNEVECGPLQIEHIVGPLLGAILAGIICLKFFPDDPSSWIRK